MAETQPKDAAPQNVMLGAALRGVPSDHGSNQLGAAMSGGSIGRANLSIKNTLKDDKAAYDQYEKFNQLANKQKARLKERLQKEQAYIAFNQLKIMNKWRQFMRDAKTNKLRTQIEIIAQNHDREVDRKDNQIKVLAADIDALEEQFQVAQRSHIRKMDMLLEVHRSRIVALHNEFERDLLTLKNEFNEERMYIVTKHALDVRRTKALIVEVDNREKQRAQDAKQTHETEREEIRNKNLEDINVLKISLEAEIEEYEKQFDAAHDRYIQNTEDKNREFAMLKAKDEKLAGDIDILLKQIDHLQLSLGSWKKKIMQNDRECRERNDTLKKERDEISRHYRHLKSKMNKFRRTEGGALGTLTLLAKDATDKNWIVLKQLKKIMVMAEIGRKMETKTEQLLPFQGYLDAADEIVDIPEISPEERNQLSEFYKKFNKVLMNKLAIEKIRKNLLHENRSLRTVLKKQLEGGVSQLSAGLLVKSESQKAIVAQALGSNSKIRH